MLHTVTSPNITFALVYLIECCRENKEYPAAACRKTVQKAPKTKTSERQKV